MEKNGVHEAPFVSRNGDSVIERERERYTCCMVGPGFTPFK